MGKNLLAGLVVLGLSCSAFGSSAQRSSARPSYSVVDVLVWGADLMIDTSPYDPDVKAEIERHHRRWDAYQSPRRRPANSAELDMVYFAQVRYERRLAAASDDPRGPMLAETYVNKLQPCYEWEGFHDCPEREAVFATGYQTANPNGPFNHYLPLLAAHRWLCTAEGYEYEKRPEDAARSRQAYERAISTARQSTALLVRRAADELTTRRRCFSER